MSDKVGVVRAAMSAWAKHDIDGVLAHVHPDIEWHYQVGSRPAIGVEAMRGILDRLKDHQLDSRWKLTGWAENGDTLFIEGVDDYRNPDGHRVQAPYAGVYRFDGALITHWRDYVDLGLMMKGEAGEPLPEWLVPLIEADPAPDA
jgi:limonene-1,2-epoxide hydrolase